MQEINKVIAIGPESTGKSSLCSALAAHFNTDWCPEFARDYLLQHGTNYTYEDLLIIAKGQHALAEEYTKRVISKWQAQGKPTSKPLLFFDTDQYVMKVWCEYVFGKCHQFILEQIVATSNQLYLLCNIDLPWIKDELREYPDLQTRSELYHIYKDIVTSQPVPWVDISGDYHERLRTAIRYVEELLI